MKNYLAVILLALMALLLVMMPMAMAEAVDAVPAESASPDLTQLLTKEVLATMAGMVLLTAILTQGIKMLFMRNSEVS